MTFNCISNSLPKFIKMVVPNLLISIGDRINIGIISPSHDCIDKAFIIDFYHLLYNIFIFLSHKLEAK